MSQPSAPSGELPKPVVAALRRVLRPLVRLMLFYGIRFQSFCDLAKTAYIQVAEEEFKLDGKPQTDSRISLLTGVQRRDVKQLREAAGAGADNLQPSLSAQLLAIWSGDPAYLDAQGQPLPLARLTSKGTARSFEELVRSVSKDFRPRVVLDEWLRQGIATLDAEDNVRLAAEAFVAPHGLDEQAFFFGQNVHDHLAATAHNLTGGAPPFLERCVFYEKMSAESVEEFKRLAEAAAMKALHSVNRDALELQKRDEGRPDAVHRANFGIYTYSEIDHENDNPVV
ncbi:MAG: hypothetical protein KGZ83_12690 [Sulfuricella sp.]|nr:hypothetical protein [Sulfuricella sp.]